MAATTKISTFKWWQAITAASLFIGYSGYYICRSNLSVATPLITQDFASEGVTKETIGQMASLGIIFYSLGKVINGILGDLVGGKKIFFIGMAGAVLSTTAFAYGTGIGFLTTAWCINRLLQSMGWGGLVKIATNWFSYKNYGKTMGFLSLSYMAGDIIAKLILGEMIQMNLTWKQLFLASAGMLAVIFFILLFLIRERPETMGFPAPEAHPDSFFTSEGKVGMWTLIKPYLSSLSFTLLLIMSFGMTAIREAFSFWIPTYLVEVAGMAAGEASKWSSIYSFTGMGSILICGYLSDHLKGKRALLIWLSCIPLAVVFIAMTMGVESKLLTVFCSALVGLFLIGPYSFLAGAMSMDAGGKQGAATAAGMVDAIGYAGGTTALWLTSRLAQESGWNAAFVFLAAIALLTCVAAFVFYFKFEKQKSA